MPELFTVPRTPSRKIPQDGTTRGMFTGAHVFPGKGRYPYPRTVNARPRPASSQRLTALQGVATP